MNLAAADIGESPWSGISGAITSYRERGIERACADPAWNADDQSSRTDQRPAEGADLPSLLNRCLCDEF